jgi:glycogen operon protein
VVKLRDRMRRNLLATLAFSQGVPMLSHGDELGRTQLGNNNAYCHDGPLTWIDWRLSEPDRELLRFARLVFLLRRQHPVLRRRSFFSGRPLAEGAMKDVMWLRAEGGEMRDDDWHDPARRALGMLLAGEAHEETDEHGHRVNGETLLLALNAGARRVHFQLPELAGRGRWRQLLNTVCLGARTLGPRGLALPERSLTLLVWRRARG